MANKDIISSSINVLEGLFKLYRTTKEYLSLPSQEEIDRLKTFKLYTINYRGKIKYKNTPLPLKTKYYRCKEQATFNLKKEAEEKGCNALINVEWDYIQCDESTPRGGIYYYKKWRATGDAVKM